MSALSVKGASLLRTHTIAAASALSVVTAGMMVAASTTGAGATTAAHRAPSVVPNATVTITPSKQLVNGEQITVHMSGFGTTAGKTLHIGECSSQIFQHQSQDYCAVPSQATTATTDASGNATATYTVRTKTWKPNNTSLHLKCDPRANHACDIIVADSLDPNMVQFAGFASLDLGKNTKTKLSGRSHVTAGSKLKLTAKTTNTFHPKGKVTFKDGKKTIKKVKEKASGVVKITEKHMKPGRHKITATYSGDPNNKTSKGKLKVKVGH